jgi:general nucleoside transport system permease protein
MMNTKTTLQSDMRTRIVWGIVLIVVGLLVLFVFAFGTEAGQVTKFGLNEAKADAILVPDLVLPSQATTYAMALVLIAVGAFQMARGVKSNSTLVTVLAFCFVMAFLVWAARDKSFSLVGMLSSSFVRATPIALAALCGVISERAGVTNIGIEGTMLFAAQVSVIVGTTTGSLWLALLSAIITGGLIAGLHAFLVIKFKVDQIISGTAINILGAGTTSFISSRFLEKNIDALNNSGTFPAISIPLLAKIPVIGPVLFDNTPIVYLTMILVVILHIVLFYTPWGLRTRAVGEHPKAADTLGVNVFLTRYVNVIIGGMFAGIGGAYFTIGSVGRFDEIMTAGKGFIGLAAMIFGKWTPIGAYTSSLIFGFADSLQVKLQILQVGIPPEFLLMAPYIVTMIVLTGVVGKAVAPAADGVAYEK